MTRILASLALAAGLALVAAAPAAAADGPVILTVSGAVAAPDRAAVDPADDKFFTYQEDAFDAAREFDQKALSELKMVSVKADFPKDGPVHEFEGPLLADVLKAAGATGGKLTVKALDGYAVEVDVEELVAKGAVVALKRDGEYFAIGDYGPTQIVFPRAERPDLKELSDDHWVWSVYHIHVN